MLQEGFEPALPGHAFSETSFFMTFHDTSVSIAVYLHVTLNTLGFL
jgi:hypothetical protein